MTEFEDTHLREQPLGTDYGRGFVLFALGGLVNGG
jgi:hypothetical protein